MCVCEREIRQRSTLITHHPRHNSDFSLLGERRSADHVFQTSSPHYHPSISLLLVPEATPLGQKNDTSGTPPHHRPQKNKNQEALPPLPPTLNACFHGPCLLLRVWQSTKIARAIVENRPFGTTGELAEVVGKCAPPKDRVKTLARVFQALRIEVGRGKRGL